MARPQTVPFQRTMPIAATGIYEVMRQVRTVQGNSTVALERIVGTYKGIIADRVISVGDMTGNTVVFASHVLYLSVSAHGQEGDDVRSLSDGQRFKVVKAFHYPNSTVLWLDVIRAL